MNEQEEAATTAGSRPATISTSQMVQDYRLARLFADVGKALKARDDDDEFDLGTALEAMRADLLAIAPEFLPPFTDEDHDPGDWDRWRELIEEAEDS